MISAFDLGERTLADLKVKECIVGEMKKPVSLENLEGAVMKVLNKQK